MTEEILSIDILTIIYRLVFETMNIPILSSISSYYPDNSIETKPLHLSISDKGILNSNNQNLSLFLQLLSNQLSIEMDRLHQKHDIFSDPWFIKIKTHFILALQYLESYYNNNNNNNNNDLSEYRDSVESMNKSDFSSKYSSNESLDLCAIELKKVYQLSIEAFENVAEFDKKVIAIKFQILPILHLNNYFKETFRYDSQLLIHDEIMNIWDEFLTLSEIQHAIRLEFGNNSPSNLTKLNSSKSIIYQIASIKSIIEEILYFNLTVQTTQQSTVELLSLEPIRLVGHDTTIFSLTTSRGILYSGGENIKLWDITSYPIPSVPLMTLYGHKGFVLSLCVYDNYLFSGSEDSFIKVWNVGINPIPSQSIVKFVGHGGPVTSLVVSSNRLYSGSRDHSIKVWDLGILSSLTSSSSSSLLLSLSISINPTSSIEIHNNWIYSIGVSRNKLFSGSEDKVIKVWNITKESNKQSNSNMITLPSQSYGIYAMVFSDDCLFTASGGKVIHVWDLTTIKEDNDNDDTNDDNSKNSKNMKSPIAYLKGHMNWVYSLVLSGGTLFSGSLDNNVCVWDITGETISSSPIKIIKGHSCAILSLAVSNGKLFSGSVDKTIQVRCF